jgi:hypothetical protein
MAESSGRPSSFFLSWVLPIGLIVGIAAGVAYPVSRAEEWSFPVAFGVVLGVGLALMAWSLLTFSVYEKAAKIRGWRCETGFTAATPSSDVRIEGEFEGTRFKLTRHRVMSTGRRNTESSELQWIGDEIRVPAFTLHTIRAVDAAIDRFVGAKDMARTIMAATGHAQPALLTLPADSALARRAEVSSPDAAAAEAFFSPARCAVLDPLLAAETVDGAQGRITIIAMGFPAPQNLSDHLAHGAAIRRALVS